MAILPQGTVTFLFTDIEGSTRLVQELGPGLYGEATVDGQRALAGHGWPHDRPIRVRMGPAHRPGQRRR